jgi:hypothetical protein
MNPEPIIVIINLILVHKSRTLNPNTLTLNPKIFDPQYQPIRPLSLILPCKSEFLYPKVC